jgi:hypothetical protein
LPGVNGFADTLPVTTLPGDAVTRAIRNQQRKADRAFEQGDYERAHRVYLGKLAPKGDKHAHYMLGVLNQNGLGVPQDLPRAVAWYALAAERGAAKAGAIGLQLLDTLDESEQARADEILAELMERYGDRRLLTDAIRRDLRELKNVTGSRTGSRSSQLVIVIPTSTGDTVINGEQYYRAIEARIEYRTQLLQGNVTLGEFELIDTPEGEASPEEETLSGNEAPAEIEQP